MYVYFFNSRKDTASQLDGSVYEGILLGPVAMSWTYTNIKIHDNDWDDFIHLSMSENGDMVRIEKYFYNYFELWNDNDPRLEEYYKTGKRIIIWEEIRNKCRGINESISVAKTRPPIVPCKEPQAMYICFLHGRGTPDEDMDDRGDGGPILGPVQVSWGDGHFKIHSDQNENLFVALPTTEEGDLVHIEGVYYGDFEVWDNKDPLLDGHREQGTRFINWDEFFAMNPPNK